MKAVFSLSTQVPGFLLTRAHALLFTAALQHAAKEYQVTLVTDRRGAEIARALEWPVALVLSLQDRFPESWRHIWMLPKIGAQEIQTEPFFHLDLDFWLLDHLSEEISAARLGVQSKDGLAVYREPNVQEIMAACGIPRSIVAVNTGFILWNDFDLLDEYVAQVYALSSKVSKMGNGTLLSIVLEQALLAHLAKEQGTEILELSPRFPAEITQADMPHARFIHFWGRSKKDTGWMAKAEARFLADFPLAHAIALRGFARL